MRVRYRINASAPAFMISILLLLAAATGGVVHAQDPKDRTGGPTASAPGAEVYFVNLQDGATVASKAPSISASEHGCRARRTGSQAFRSPPSADRHRAAAARPADSERLQSSALRRRPDRGGDHALARRAHVATAAGGQGSHPAYAAGHVGAHSGEGRRRHAGPGGRRDRGRPHGFGAGRRGLFRRSQGRRHRSLQDHRQVRVAEHGGRSGGCASRAFRPPSSVGRHRVAAARPADSERLQSSALRRRPDRGGDHARARRAHVATAAGGQGSHPACAAGHVAAHSGEGRRRRAGPAPARAGGPRLRRPAPRSISSISRMAPRFRRRRPSSSGCGTWKSPRRARIASIPATTIC